MQNLKMYLKTSENEANFVILNIPHGGIEIPKGFRNHFLLSDSDLEHEIYSMADLYSKDLYFDLTKKYSFIESKVSRILVDTERFELDHNESMSKVGMGVLYAKTQDGRSLREVMPKDREKLIENIYKPYHAKLSEMVREKLDKFGKCIIIDCHTFPNNPRAYEPIQETLRPDICIGSDDFHTPSKLSESLMQSFYENGFSVKLNSPFGGSIVPLGYFGINRNVSSVMIEINRRLYMNENTFEKKDNFHKISETICRLVDQSLKIY